MVDAKALLEGTTKGPWAPVEFGGTQIGGSKGFAEAVCTMWDSQSRKGKRNAALIAAAPTLATEHAALTAEVARLREACSAAVAFIESHAADPDLTADMVKNYARYRETRAALEGQSNA